MKTIWEHFESLPEPYRSQAIMLTPMDTLKIEAISQKAALLIAFDWAKTQNCTMVAARDWDHSPQGFKYWFNFYETL